MDFYSSDSGQFSDLNLSDILSLLLKSLLHSLALIHVPLFFILPLLSVPLHLLCQSVLVTLQNFHSSFILATLLILCLSLPLNDLHEIFSFTLSLCLKSFILLSKLSLSRPLQVHLRIGTSLLLSLLLIAYSHFFSLVGLFSPLLIFSCRSVICFLLFSAQCSYFPLSFCV
jgi:hypothetical protein